MDTNFPTSPVTKRHLVAGILLVVWAVFFCLVTALGAWMGTGKYALAGPSTPKDDIFAAVTVVFSIVQLAIAIVLCVRYRPRLFRVALAIIPAPFILWLV